VLLSLLPSCIACVHGANRFMCARQTQNTFGHFVPIASAHIANSTSCAVFSPRLCCAAVACGPPRRQDDGFLDSWAVHLHANASADTVAAESGFVNLGLVGSLPNVYHFARAGCRPGHAQCTRALPQADHHTQRLAAHRHVHNTHQQRTARRVRRSITLKDPLYSQQW